MPTKLRIENDTAVDISLLDRIEFSHKNKTVTGWAGNTNIATESAILYAYLMSPEGQKHFIEFTPAPPKP